MTDAAATRAPRNRTLALSDADAARLAPRLARLDRPTPLAGCIDRTVLGDCLRVLPLLPRGAFDLVIADPPYNLAKSYAGTAFRPLPPDAYERWLHSWLALVRPLMTPRASIYICSEWRCSAIVQRAAEAFFTIRNRITWEREKGRGAARNWKNCSEDIWFCTASDAYYFDVDAVKLRRKVVAPYRHGDGTPKDWCPTPEGHYRTTSPSNLWTDLSVPFWSMPENTDHPAQKPEKLLAKLILASCPPGGTVLDPFLGSGTTSVVARKLGRRFVGIEIEPAYCLLAERRLELSRDDRTIQGYADGVFWERNSSPAKPRQRAAEEPRARGDRWVKTLV